METKCRDYSNQTSSILGQQWERAGPYIGMGSKTGLSRNKQAFVPG